MTKKNDRESDNVIPLFRPPKNAAPAPSKTEAVVKKVDESPFLDLPPGGRIEVGTDCLFLSLKPSAGFAVRRNWSTWVSNLEPRLVAAGVSYELMKESGGFVDCVRVHVRKSAQSNAM